MSFIGNIIDQFLNWLKSLFWKKQLELTLVGLQNSGKSTLLNRLANGEFSEIMMPTVGFNMRKVSKGNVNIKLWDISGQERFRGMWERYCRGTNAIIYVVDSADLNNLPLSKAELRNLLEKVTLKGIPLLLLGNKNDLENHLTEEELIKELELDTIDDREVGIYSISAKNNINIDKVLDWLVARNNNNNNNNNN